MGEKYSTDYVTKLYNSCVRHCSKPFVFTILHDENKSYNFNVPNIRLIKVEPMAYLHRNNLWWYKMQAFREDVAKNYVNLFFDLDVVLVNNIDKFWEYENNKFTVLQDFNRHWFPSYKRCNSSVFKFTDQMAVRIYNKFFTDSVNYIRKYRGDQDWMDEHILERAFWPKKWAMSWKWEVYKGGLLECNSTKYASTTTEIDKDCSVLVFHGKPDPHEIPEDIIRYNWI